jgi:hypothetical protein
MPRSQSNRRGGGNGSKATEPNSRKTDIIFGKDITPKPDKSSFIGCLSLIALMVAMYLSGIYNCGQWLFGLAIAITWCNLPKKVEEKMFQYNFTIYVLEKSYSFFGISPLPSINGADIQATVKIFVEQNEPVTSLAFRKEIINVIVECSGLTCSYLLNTDCFENTSGYDNHVTKSKIIGDIVIYIGSSSFTINKGSVPEIKYEILN